ncbi:MAG: carbohydrate kinase family protein [Candidatus Atabeyarchaeum deiterrae]
MKLTRIGALGALNVDIIIHGTAPSETEDLRNWAGPSEITLLAAGSVGYFSQNFAKLDCEVHLVSSVADDPFGEFVLSTLKKAKIRTNHVSIESGTKSGIGVYVLLFGGQKRPITFQLPTHNGWPLRLAREKTEYLLDTDLIHCGGYLHFFNLWNGELAKLFAKARRRGLITSLDPQFPLSSLEPPWLKVLRPVLAHTDILFLDENEALGVSGAGSIEDATRILGEINVDKVVIKLGEKGCLVLSEKKELQQPAMKPSKFVDSVGAGDSFDVGFLYGILRSYTLADATKLAVYTASKTLEGTGVTSFPTKSELP